MPTKNFKVTTLAVVIKFDANNPREIAIKTFLESLEKRTAKLFLKTIFSLEFTKDIDYSIDSSPGYKTVVLSEKLENIVSTYAKPLQRSGDNIFWFNFSRNEKDYGSVIPVAYLLGDGFSAYFFTLMEKYYSAFIDAFMTKIDPKDSPALSTKEDSSKAINPVTQEAVTPPPTQKPTTKEELMAYMKSISAQNTNNTSQNNTPM